MAGRDIRSGVVEVDVDDDGGDGLEKLENSSSASIFLFKTLYRRSSSSFSCFNCTALSRAIRATFRRPSVAAAWTSARRRHNPQFSRRAAFSALILAHSDTALGVSMVESIFGLGSSR